MYGFSWTTLAETAVCRGHHRSQCPPPPRRVTQRRSHDRLRRAANDVERAIRIASLRRSGRARDRRRHSHAGGPALATSVLHGTCAAVDRSQGASAPWYALTAQGSIFGVGWSPDRTLLASVTDERCIRSWPLARHVLHMSDRLITTVPDKMRSSAGATRTASGASSGSTTRI